MAPFFPTTMATWLPRKEPTLLWGLQIPHQQLFNHSALAIQPLAMVWVCSELGPTGRAQHLPVLVAWDLLTAHWVLMARPLSCILGMGLKGANSQRANKSSWKVPGGGKVTPIPE